MAAVAAAATFPAHAAIELEPAISKPSPAKGASRTRVSTEGKPQQQQQRHQQPSYTVRRSTERSSDGSLVERPEERAPLRAEPPRKTWRSPRINRLRLPAMFYDFIVFGMTDGSYGALLPSLEAYYDISYIVVSLIFLAPFAGYTVAAFLCSPMHMLVGQRGIALIAPLSRLVTFVVMALHPPYPVAVVFLAVAGLGNGISDAAWNSYLGDMERTNEILGIMHAFYGLGATISPLIITAMVDTYRLPWWTFYYLMIGMTLLDACLGASAFWAESGVEYRRKNVVVGATAGDGSGAGGNDSVAAGHGATGRNRQALRNKITWICSGFLLFYVGTEVSLGGWIITFMTKVRNGQPFESGLTATGFWLGITLGRVVLGFVTGRVGERLAVAGYLALVIVLQLIFWLVPSFYVSAVVVAFQGFFMGPLFPAAVVAAARLLPKRLHVSSIGISSAIGGGGAAVLPFVTGVVVNARGVQTLQPIILAFLACQMAFWLLLPKFPKHGHND